ncbi:hypothetical protein CEXT_493371 [Caerostris extrusa]|uniref:Uncharacterized protein n=1 Tax=Caerostris extrusa TaxID=172846 RepID=A0AAV4XU17_CAEEX|nr:hypothetical protein CEXT_493371 [Caerostris extrusa]
MSYQNNNPYHLLLHEITPGITLLCKRGHCNLDQKHLRDTFNRNRNRNPYSRASPKRERERVKKKKHEHLKLKTLSHDRFT